MRGDTTWASVADAQACTSQLSPSVQTVRTLRFVVYYVGDMDAVVTFFIRLLEVLFVVGWIGSFLVILLSGVEDMETVFEHDPPAPPSEATLPPTAEHL